MKNLSGLANSYHPLLSKMDLAKMLTSVEGDEVMQTLDKKELHARINALLFDNYAGEAELKYKLASFFRKKKYEAGFEIKSGTSRADFLAINGFTQCFEIKSDRDNLDRLSAQLRDYLELFEFVYVVVGTGLVPNIMDQIPPQVGVWTFKGSRKYELVPAEQNMNLSPRKQLSILTKKEREKYFGYPGIEQICVSFDSQEINSLFKTTLKNRYFTRWSFVKQNWENILPMDIQFFFNKNIDPELIYSV